jgi:hypothetical protein
MSDQQHVVEGRSDWERALDAVKNVVVIVTCLAILYTLYKGYQAVDALGDALSELGRTWGGGE